MNGRVGLMAALMYVLPPLKFIDSLSMPPLPTIKDVERVVRGLRMIGKSILDLYKISKNMSYDKALFYFGENIPNHTEAFNVLNNEI